LPVTIAAFATGQATRVLLTYLLVLSARMPTDGLSWWRGMMRQVRPARCQGAGYCACAAAQFGAP
jgi:hypothetical protein